MSTYAGGKQLELVVDLYHGAKTASLHSGALQPSLAPIISTNNPPMDDPRLVIRVCVHCSTGRLAKPSLKVPGQWALLLVAQVSVVVTL